MPEGLDRNSFFFLQYSKAKVTGVINAQPFTAVSNLFFMSVTPTNPFFNYYVFTDFYMSVSMFSDSVDDTGIMDMEVYVVVDNTIITGFTRQQFVPPFQKDFNLTETHATNAEGASFLANGSNYVVMTVDVDFAGSSTFKYAGSQVIRGVYMNE